MKTALFPHRFRLIGWILLPVGVAFSLALMLTGFEIEWLRIPIPAILNDSALDEILRPLPPGEDPMWRSENMANEIGALMVLFGALFIAFSKERVEDEYLSHVRLSAMVWALYVNTAILVLGILLLYSFHFLYFMMFNLFAVLFLFIGRYHYLLSKIRRSDAE